jgi:hypothetical protein
MDHNKLFKLKFMARSDAPHCVLVKPEHWSLEGLLNLPDSPVKDQGLTEGMSSRMSFGHFNPCFEALQKKRRQTSESKTAKHLNTGCTR